MNKIWLIVLKVLSLIVQIYIKKWEFHNVKSNGILMINFSLVTCTPDKQIEFRYYNEKIVIGTINLYNNTRDNIPIIIKTTAPEFYSIMPNL